MTTSRPASVLNGVAQQSVGQIIDRLMAQAHARVPRPVVAELVGQCEADLQPITDAALPEMLERLARHRLTYYLSDPSAWQD